MDTLLVAGGERGVKQGLGWTLEQATPGVMTWTTPAGRRYTVSHTGYRG